MFAECVISFRCFRKGRTLLVHFMEMCTKATIQRAQVRNTLPLGDLGRWILPWDRVQTGVLEYDHALWADILIAAHKWSDSHLTSAGILTDAPDTEYVWLDCILDALMELRFAVRRRLK